MDTKTRVSRYCEILSRDKYPAMALMFGLMLGVELGCKWPDDAAVLQAELTPSPGKAQETLDEMVHALRGMLPL
jgi:hypothetical protein